MARVFREHVFGPDDEVVVLKTTPGFTLGKIAVFGRITGPSGAASVRVFGSFVSDPATNELQTIDLGNIAAADTYTLTFNAHQSALITYSADMTTDITNALVGLVDFEAGDISVTKVSLTVYTVTFQGQWANQDTGAITITTVTGFTPTGVTESSKGGTGSEDITDTAALGTAISQVVADHENRYPYLTLAYDGDGDPDLTAEVYVVLY